MSTAPAGEGALIDLFRRARRDRGLAVIEGFHALKHALRFDAEVSRALCADPEGLERLARDLAPDLAKRLGEIVTTVAPEIFAQLAPRAPRTGVVALASRAEHDPAEVLADKRPAPIVLLEEPRDLNNVGACIRVAAAADAAGVLVTGRHDPWHADSIRGAAGLHFALPVLWLEQVPQCDRPLIAMDPDGEPLMAGSLPPRAMLAFGSERQGLSEPLLTASDATVTIPMRPGVSSLNLATSVSATLFAMRLCG